MQQHATLLATNIASCLHGVLSYEKTDVTTRNRLLAKNVASCLHGIISYEQTAATTRNIFSQQCCVLFARGYKLRENWRNNTQHY